MACGQHSGKWLGQDRARIEIRSQMLPSFRQQAAPERGQKQGYGAAVVGEDGTAERGLDVADRISQAACLDVERDCSVRERGAGGSRRELCESSRSAVGREDRGNQLGCVRGRLRIRTEVEIGLPQQVSSEARELLRLLVAGEALEQPAAARPFKRGELCGEGRAEHPEALRGDM